MRRNLHWPLILTAILGCHRAVVDSSISSSASKAKPDAERIQGDWVIDSAMLDGEPVADDKAHKGTKVVITATKFIFKPDDKGNGPGAHESNYSIDASKDPKEIDVIEFSDVKTSSGSAMTLERRTKGIYVLDADTLKICLAIEPEDPRPTELITKKGGTSGILVFKRQ